MDIVKHKNSLFSLFMTFILIFKFTFIFMTPFIYCGKIPNLQGLTFILIVFQMT